MATITRLPTRTHIVEEVRARAELDAVAECIWAVFEHDAAHKIFFQARGDPAASLADCQERLWREHVDDADGTGRWIFVRDASSPRLRVLGACQWRLHRRNPFPNGVPAYTADWWPVGVQRTFATEFVRQNMLPRAQWMARPHSGLSWCVVRNENRRQGIGRALMQWGVEQTDALGLESFIEASADGRQLYAAMGYRPVLGVDVDMVGLDASAEWQDLVRSHLPFRFDGMWRPVRGVWEAGEPERTWNARKQRTAAVGI